MAEPSPSAAGPPGRVGRARQALARLLGLPVELEPRFEALEQRSDRNHHLVDRILEVQHDHGGRLLDELERLERIEHALAAERAELAATSALAAEARHAAAALALQLAGVDAPAPTDVLVSVVLPTWQRAAVLGDAMASVSAQTHQRWELLVVDDGSTDHTADVVARYADDPRVTYERIDHAGVSAARNHALGKASGEVVAFLDSDNTWHPTHLARAVAVLTAVPAAGWAHSGQVLVDGATGALRLRSDQQGLDTLIDANFIDLNTVSVRRAELDAVGGFDLSLPRLGDWDLALRLAARSAPARTGAVTSRYRTDLPDRIEVTVPVQVLAHGLRARHRGRPAEGLRVLFAEWHYPQVTETYIEVAVRGLLALGAHVEVWCQDDVAVPYEPVVPVHRGPSLGEAIESAGPDVVVTHWLHKGLELLPATQAAGVPHVVCTHGFEYEPQLVAELLEGGAVVHTFPHLVVPEWADHPRLLVTRTMFDDERFRPADPADKDPRLVVRTSAGLLTKDLDTFLLAANFCPEHRFVLVLGHAWRVEERTELIVERAAELGSRAEIRLDVGHAEVAELLGRAGTYLHTHGTDHPVSMPMSIAEAMATGCRVLGRDLPGVGDYLGPAGSLYGGETPDDRAKSAAELVNASLDWSAARWAEVAQRSSEHAYQHHANRDVTDRMLRQWRSLLPLP
jgi:glycosyltransferase involved in cell wall biosynthesis